METAELIREARQGSAAAQKCLFDQWCGSMLTVCRRYVKNTQDAEELLLDGFYKFFKSLPSFRYQGDPALYAWLKKVMVNECLMFLRKRNSFTMLSEPAGEEAVVAEEVLDRLSARDILGMILQLPVGYRTVFNLFEMEGRSHREVAELLKISEGTSRSQLSKAKALLQKMILQNDMGYDKQQQQ